jgi:hypothetical protein
VPTVCCAPPAFFGAGFGVSRSTPWPDAEPLAALVVRGVGVFSCFEMAITSFPTEAV